MKPALYIEGDLANKNYDILAGDIKEKPQKLAQVLQIFLAITYNLTLAGIILWVQ